MHFREDAKESLTEAVTFDVEFDGQEGEASSEASKTVQAWKFSPVPPITVVSVEGSVGEESNELSFTLSNGHEVTLECKYVISPNPSDSKKNYANLKVVGKDVTNSFFDVKDEYMGFIEDYGSPLIAALKCYEKHYTKF